uniref:Uncharacterized protein n=1 Tax=Arundo donax TaxID=35708 RepID=A0A0A8XQM8_ARUDO
MEYSSKSTHHPGRFLPLWYTDRPSSTVAKEITAISTLQASFGSILQYYQYTELTKDHHSTILPALPLVLAISDQQLLIILKSQSANGAEITQIGVFHK